MRLQSGDHGDAVWWLCVPSTVDFFGTRNQYFLFLTPTAPPSVDLAVWRSTSSRHGNNRNREKIMRRLATMTMLAAAIMASPGWAQTATAPTAKGHSDAIVKMRQEIAAARKEYKRKVAEAQKAFDETKAAAAKERDAAIKAAHATAGA